MIAGKMTTLARPYASAAFEYAVEKNSLAAWEAMLNGGAAIVQNEMMPALLTAPEVTSKQLADLFCDILAGMLDQEKRNFIHLLAENKRLPILPDIAILFTKYRAEYEKVITVDVRSAIALDEPYQQKLIKSLTKRLRRQVSLQCEVDPSLLGGAVISAGDMVIDGSIRGKLNRLLESL